MSIPTRADLDALVSARLAEDPTFRETLITDPHTAISELLGIAVPDLVTITVHQESLTDVHLVLPPTASLPTEELDEDDLELVAGGNCWANSCVCLI